MEENSQSIEQRQCTENLLKLREEGKSFSEIGKLVGMSKSAVVGRTARWRKSQGACREAPQSAHVPVCSGVPKGLSEEELLQKHSTYHKLKRAVEGLVGGVFVPEAELVAPLRISGGYRNHLDRAEFDAFRGRAGGKTYYSNPSSIARMKDQGVLV